MGRRARVCQWRDTVYPHDGNTCLLDLGHVSTPIDRRDGAQGRLIASPPDGKGDCDAACGRAKIREARPEWCFPLVEGVEARQTEQRKKRTIFSTTPARTGPRKISRFDNLSLLDLIVKTGIADAITTQLGGLKGNKTAIAETIENNVRSRIIKERLNDPAFYEKMSALLDEIIEARKAKAIEYEEYLKRIAELAKKVEAGQSEDTPPQLNTPGAAPYMTISYRRHSLEPRCPPRQRPWPQQRMTCWIWPSGSPTRSSARASYQEGLVRSPEEWNRSGAHFPHYQGIERILTGAQLKLGDIAVDVVLKDIKNVHLSVHPPTGRVRISAPSRMNLDTIRVFAISRLDWIKQQQKKLREQERETRREYADRESHYVWGKRYMLKVSEEDAAPLPHETWTY